MKIISSGYIEKYTAIILFGNGYRDRRIIGKIASKYNHFKTLLDPSLPHLTGSAVLRQLIELIEETPASIYIIVIDREHFEELMNKLPTYAFRVPEQENLADGLIKITCERGPRKITLYIATLGLTEKGCIEENLAQLIELVKGEKVKPEKHIINTWLAKNKIKDYELIDSASINQLKRAFPAITQLLEILKQDPA